VLGRGDAYETAIRGVELLQPWTSTFFDVLTTVEILRDTAHFSISELSSMHIRYFNGVNQTCCYHTI
jgi:hypothetical protein